MSKVAILSGGASLNQTWNKDKDSEYDCVIAINRAAFVYECDYWVAGDYPIVNNNKHLVLGKPTLVTRHKTERKLVNFPLRVINWDYFLHKYKPPIQHIVYTITGALIFARSCNPEIIDIYGNDQKLNGEYCDGTRNNHCTRQERWDKEIPAYNKIVKWLEDDNIVVNNIRPTGENDV